MNPEKPIADKKPMRKSKPYKPGELETILSLAPTSTNIKWLSQLLERTEAAIEIVYKIAFSREDFGKRAQAQKRKIAVAKKRLGIRIGRRKSN